MKRSIKGVIFAILILILSVSLFGCTKGASDKVIDKIMGNNKTAEDLELDKQFDFTLVNDSHYLVTEYKGTSVDVKIPSKYNGKPVLGFGQAFKNSKINSIEIPSSVDTITYEAFQGCTELKTVKLNEGLKTISDSAFQETGIKEITIPSTVEEMHSYVFHKCRSLKKINCRAKTQPSGWHKWWNINTSAEVVWGYVG